MTKRNTPGAQILLGLFLGAALVWMLEAALFELRWGWQGMKVDVRGERTLLKIGDGERRLTVVQDGSMETDADNGLVRILGPGGHVSIDERTRLRELWYLATWKDGGEHVEWRVDGELEPVDADTRDWLKDRLLEIERLLARDAPRRIERLVAAGGPAAALDEIERLEGSTPVSRYGLALLEIADLAPGQVGRLLAAATRQVGSDQRMAELLELVPIEGPNWREFSRAARTIGSDRALADVLIEHLPTEEGVYDWMEAAGTIGSDSELARVLIAFVSTLTEGEPLPRSFPRLLSTVGSDTENRRVLEAALVERRSDAEDLDRLLREARSIGSDNEMSALLLRVALSEKTGSLVAGFWLAAETVASDRELAEVLMAAAERPGLSTEDLERLVEVSETLGTDRHQADVLVAAWNAGAARDRVRRAAERGLGAQREADRVLEVLGGRGPDTG